VVRQVNACKQGVAKRPKYTKSADFRECGSEKRGTTKKRAIKVGTPGGGGSKMFGGWRQIFNSILRDSSNLGVKKWGHARGVERLLKPFRWKLCKKGKNNPEGEVRRTSKSRGTTRRPKNKKRTGDTKGEFASVKCQGNRIREKNKKNE